MTSGTKVTDKRPSTRERTRRPVQEISRESFFGIPAAGCVTAKMRYSLRNNEAIRRELDERLSWTCKLKQTIGSGAFVIILIQLLLLF